MPNARYADRFVDHVAGIYSARVRDEIQSIVEAILSFPEIGSTNVRPSLKQAYGQGLRKMPVSSFVIVYRYDMETDTVEFIAMPRALSVK